MSTSSWLVTVPKRIKWEDYLKELAEVEDGESVLNFKVPNIPKKMKNGDRCYVVWNGRVRGFMSIVGYGRMEEDWRCTTTGQLWTKGNYIQRSGKFFAIEDGEEIKGFQGIRGYKLKKVEKLADLQVLLNLRKKK